MIRFTTYFAITVTAILAAAGFLRQKSKLLFIVQGVWMWILTGLNTYSADWNSNYPLFVTAKASMSLDQELYQNLSSFFKGFGVDFIAFNATMSFVALCLIFYRIAKYAKRPALVTSMMYFYPLVDFVIQKRYFLAMALVFWALPMAVSEFKKDKVIYLVLVLIAGWIHISVLFYLPFVLINLIPDRILKRVSLITIIILSLSPAIIFRLFQLLPFVSESRFNLYFITYAKNSSLVKYAFWIAFHLCFFVMIIYIYDSLQKRNMINAKDQKILYMNYGALFLIPFYAFDPAFFRLFRQIIILNYIYVSNLLQNGRKQQKYAVLACVFQMSLAIALFVLMYMITGDFQKLVMPIFENNVFLDLLTGRG